jgi:hypothetical protein
VREAWPLRAFLVSLLHSHHHFAESHFVSSFSLFIPLLSSPSALASLFGLLTRGTWGWSPLEMAVQNGLTEMSLYLLTLIGPEEDLGRRYREGNTLLHYAGANGNLAFIEALVQRGVDFDASNDAGIRPLDFAVRLIEQY